MGHFVGVRNGHHKFAEMQSHQMNEFAVSLRASHKLNVETADDKKYEKFICNKHEKLPK